MTVRTRGVREAARNTRSAHRLLEAGITSCCRRPDRVRTGRPVVLAVAYTVLSPWVAEQDAGARDNLVIDNN